MIQYIKINNTNQIIQTKYRSTMQENKFIIPCCGFGRDERLRLAMERLQEIKCFSFRVFILDASITKSRCY